ncbi:MAG: hypothetical protein ACJAT4_001171 [Granulosicoccus sp.]|jgi:hypothetical protein
MTLAQIKKDLKSLVVKDLEKALNKFESILNSDASLFNDIIMQQSSNNGLKREINQGIIGNENANMRKARIRNAILSMIDDLEEEDVNMASVVLTPVKEEEKRDEGERNPNQSPANSDIYISYAWGGESENIVNQLDKELQSKGMKVTRDKRDLGYKGSIVEFMKDIGRGNKIIVVISEKYLKSENCMFELTRIYENKDFAKRIFPIILEDSNIYSPVSRLDYIDYWNKKITELDVKIRSMSGLNLTEIQQELNNYGDIRASFDKMAFILKDMNALTPEMHRNENFEDIYNQLTSS